jgi:hypothetical protein
MKHPGDASDEERLTREVLATITPIEKALWGRTIEASTREPTSRPRRWIPRYGIKGATYGIIADRWLSPAVVTFFAGFAMEWFSAPDSPWQIVGHVLDAATALFLLCSVVRLGMALHFIRQHRRADRRTGNGKAETDPGHA